MIFLNKNAKLYVFGPTTIPAVCEDDEFRCFQSRFQYITRVVKFFEEHYQATPSNVSLTRAFEVHHHFLN
jgi:hypothetical protein